MQDMSKQRFDVIVVGSGASGGWAAKRLSEAGVKVALLDCGRPQSDQNFTEHMPAFDLKYRNRVPEVVRQTRPIQKDCYACTEFNYQWFSNDIDEPYATAPGTQFSWQGRVRMVGGRTNVWGRVSLRLSDLDLKAASFDGFGADWPLAYKDLEPYYDLVEEYVGVSGRAEGYAYLPDGKFQPEMALSCLGGPFSRPGKGKAGLGGHVPPAPPTSPEPLNGRAPCHYCGPCDHGCVTHSYFNSSFTTVADALASGHCTLIPNAMAYKVLMDPDRNRARGMLYIDRNTREAKEVEAEVVVLSAQALESVRILLNSAEPAASPRAGEFQRRPGPLFDGPRDGRRRYRRISRTGHQTQLERAAPALRLVRSALSQCALCPERGQRSSFAALASRAAAIRNLIFKRRAFGAAYKKSILNPVTTVRLGGFGESLGRWENYVEIDPSVRDTFGIPALAHAHDLWRKRARHGAGHGGQRGGDAGGCRGERTSVRVMKPSIPGWAIHEVGIARMGNDPKKTVLNAFLQTHDVKNLFVMDGAGFPSTGCQNPTLTIMALTVRSCDYLMQEMKKGNV